MKLTRRLLMGGVAGGGLMALAGPGLARQAVQPHGLDDFFVRPGVLKVAMSPSGERIALVRELRDGESRRAVLDVLDASNPSAPPLRHPIGDVDCESLDWASDHRVLIGLALKSRATAVRVSAATLASTGGEEVVSRRMISIDPATGGAVVLFDGETQRMRNTRDLGAIVDVMHDDDDHVLMIAPTQARGQAALYKVNVLTGRAQEFERGDFDTIGWKTRNGVPVLRYDINDAGNALDIMVRAPGENRWSFVRRTPLFQAPEFEFVANTDRDHIILVAARRDDEDVQSVREFDLRSRTYGPPMNSRAGADVFGGLIDHRGEYLGAAYWGDRLEYEFARPELAAHHRAMNRFFDNECNVQLIDIDRSLNRFLAYVTGPREPGAWYLYDRAARSFVNLAPRTALETARLGKAEAIDVTTRDGQTIRAYLTAPPSGAPGPLVVMPHGGPEVRDMMVWDRQVQVLAAEGWWVLQPNFRGSGGFGRAFAAEGWGRWGERMQEDVEDAVAQVIRDKGLDGARVGIMGTSYGAYAALMGAVRRPDLYKAAVGICGVYDLPDVLSEELRDDPTPDNAVYQYWTTRIGDPRQDRAALEAASPRRRADEIRCPVILVHGADDPVLPVFQSRRMRDALNGKVDLEYIEVRGAGHADWDDEVEHDLMLGYVGLFAQAFA